MPKVRLEQETEIQLSTFQKLHLIGLRLLQTFYRPRRLLGLALVIIAIVFAPRIVKLLPDLQQQPQYRIQANHVVLQPAQPNWIPDDLVKQVFQQKSLPGEMSLLDPDLTKTMAFAFAEHPWIEQVKGVVKQAGQKVRVHVEYRQPVALAEMRSGYYPLDRFATILPPQDFTADVVNKYPRIRNIQSVPNGPAGTRWDDVSIQGAAQLCHALLPHWQTFEFDAIVLPNLQSAQLTTDDLIYQIRTRSGSLIIWGRSPQSDHPGELTVNQKVGRLEKYLSDFGTFGKPDGPYEIDIRHWQEISRRPLTARQRLHPFK